MKERSLWITLVNKIKTNDSIGDINLFQVLVAVVGLGRCQCDSGPLCHRDGQLSVLAG